jgi:glyoxylase-like metal-dependent hydrolase (beta-lactamase superfamily II)
MHIERASDDIYIFTSERYAQVTASLIVSNKIGVLIDTMLYPSESARIALFAKERCPDGVRYVIYTGHEADHVYGAFLFPQAEIIAHEKAREVLIEKGFDALAQAKQTQPEFVHNRLRLPTYTFKHGAFTLRLPGKTLEVIHMPGHTADGCSVLLHEERILFAGDAIMALPTIVNGEVDVLKHTIERVAGMQLEYIVQGHGELILRGEIKENLRRATNYLDHIRNKAQKVVDSRGTRDEAKAIPIEQCGMSRVLLNGAVVQLHIANMAAMYDRLSAEKESKRAAAKKAREANKKVSSKTKTASRKAATSKSTRAKKKTAPKKKR